MENFWLYESSLVTKWRKEERIDNTIISNYNYLCHRNGVY